MCTDNTLDRMLQKVVQPDEYYLECTLAHEQFWDLSAFLLVAHFRSSQLCLLIGCTLVDSLDMSTEPTFLFFLSLCSRGFAK